MTRRDGYFTTLRRPGTRSLRPGLLRSGAGPDRGAQSGRTPGQAAFTVSGAALEGEPGEYTVAQVPCEGRVTLAGPVPITE